MVTKKYPDYFKKFKCIGGKCSDSCCIGWNIDIDKTTFKQYFKVKDVEMKKMFQKNIQNNQYCISEDIDYGIVKLKKDKRCPFLDNENYCVIHSNLGEEYLSNVCTCFPRLVNKIDDYYELSLDVACPEAARIILLEEKGIKFKEYEEPLGRHILSNVIQTKGKIGDNSTVRYFKEIRNFCIDIITDRNFTLNERLYILGDFISNIEDEIENNFKNVVKYIQNYSKEIVVKDYCSDNMDYILGNKNMNYLIQIDFFNKMVKILNVDKEVESDRFRIYTSNMLNGYTKDGLQNINENTQIFINAFEEYQGIFMDKYDYIFENYLVNFIYNNMFPFNEVVSLFDTYFMLLMRFGLIRFYLVGMYLNNNNSNRNEIVNFIQCFSKTIEHHKNYLINSLEYVRRKELNNMEFAKVLI